MRTLLYATLAACAAAVPHERVGMPEGWRKGAVSSVSELTFTFALKHSAEQKQWLQQTVDAVSIPGNPRYGKYLTLDEVVERMRVPEAHAASVMHTLRTAGFHNVQLLRSGDFITAAAVPRVAATFFDTEFCKWHHDNKDAHIIRACEQAYHLPPSVAAVVDFVGGLVHFPSTTGPRVVQGIEASGDVGQLRSTYNMVGVKPKGRNSTTAFTQFIGQRYNDKDVERFVKKYSPEQEGQAIAKKVGDTAQGSGVEALLDAEYLLAMGNGVETWVWTNQNKNTVNNQEPWVQFFTNVSSDAQVPLLFSISYGEGENTLTADYIQRSDTELQKIAARGITVLSASGDNGSGCTRGKFVANFPASLPHITSVGGTARCTPGASAASFSSGGFSASFDRPSWQETAVRAFLSSGRLPPASVFNEKGRGYPDVAACGSVTICESGFCGLPVEGTSCACPIFAGVMGLANDARLAAGKPSLGFLAPALYAAYGRNPAAFNDVVSGTTQGCSGNAWRAEKGWDPTTGLGTPNYAKLVDTLLSL